MRTTTRVSHMRGVVTQEPLPADAAGPDVVAELFRDGEEPLWGMFNIVDGGFAMGSNLPLYSYGEDSTGVVVETSDGQRKTIPKKADFGTLSSGGLY